MKTTINENDISFGCNVKFFIGTFWMVAVAVGGRDPPRKANFERFIAYGNIRRESSISSHKLVYVTYKNIVCNVYTIHRVRAGQSSKHHNTKFYSKASI